MKTKKTDHSAKRTKQTAKKLKRKQLIEEICDALYHGMAAGFSVDMALMSRNIKKTDFIKYHKHPLVSEALVNGESRRIAYWHGQMHNCVTNKKNHTAAINQILIKLYDTSTNGAGEGVTTPVPRVNIFSISSKRARKILGSKVIDNEQ